MRRDGGVAGLPARVPHMTMGVYEREGGGPGVVLDMVSGSGVGIPACWSFTHSCALNDDDNDNLVIIFAVVYSRGAQWWNMGILRASGDGGGLT